MESDRETSTKELQVAALRLKMQDSEFLARIHEEEVFKLRQIFPLKASEAQEQLDSLYRVECLLGEDLRLVLYRKGGEQWLTAVQLLVKSPGKIEEHVGSSDIKDLKQDKKIFGLNPCGDGSYKWKCDAYILSSEHLADKCAADLLNFTA